MYVYEHVCVCGGIFPCDDLHCIYECLMTPQTPTLYRVLHTTQTAPPPFSPFALLEKKEGGNYYHLHFLDKETDA